MIQKIHSKKPILETTLFTVNELTVEVKPSVIRNHHNIERKSTVHILPIDDNDVFLISQYRYNLGKDVIECVAGFIEENEDPLDAAKRELQEETGLSAATWKTLPMIELGGGSIKAKQYLYIASGLTKGATAFDESESIETIRIPLMSAVKKVMTGEIDIVTSMSLILMANELQREGKLYE